MGWDFLVTVCCWIVGAACLGIFYGLSWAVAHIVYTPFRSLWRKMTGVPQLCDRELVRLAALQAAHAVYHDEVVPEATIVKTANAYEEAITLYLMCIDNGVWRAMKAKRQEAVQARSEYASA